MRPRITRPLSSKRLLILSIGLAGAMPLAATAQTVTAADYDRATRMLAPTLNPLVLTGAVAATWLPNDRFWYRNRTASGTEFVLVDAAKRTRAPLFDQAKLAAALGSAAGATYVANALPFSTVELSSDGQAVTFDVGKSVV